MKVNMKLTWKLKGGKLNLQRDYTFVFQSLNLCLFSNNDCSTKVWKSKLATCVDKRSKTKNAIIAKISTCQLWRKRLNKTYSDSFQNHKFALFTISMVTKTTLYLTFESVEENQMFEKLLEWLETNFLGLCAKVDVEECIETFDEIWKE